MMERDRRFIVEGTASFTNQTSEEAYFHVSKVEDNVVQEQVRSPKRLYSQIEYALA